MLTYEQARRTVIDQVAKAKGPRATANLSVWDALGFVLAGEIKADRE
jgi:molybdopterin biosynthesis enzyme